MKLVIVVPVFNDWVSLDRLLKEVRSVVVDRDMEVSVLVVNDDSSVAPPGEWHSEIPCKILHLTCNLGHQRAIAIGLSQLAESFTFDAVLVMDADGEDKPQDIVHLLEASQQNPDAIVVARRDKRSEGKAFRLGYQLYQWIFRLFTGQRLPFGNFCLIPGDVLRRVVFQGSLWNHLAATILRSRFEIVMVSTERGVRYAGEPKMNVGSLVLLGLSAVSVYSDVALLRTLFVSLLLSILTVVGISITMILRLFSEVFIPGWASYGIASMTVVLVQCLIVSASVLFIVLSNRSNRGFIPARHFKDYVLRIDSV
jgi:polyisoprenyl-phosphate glycosyltransferase